MSSNTDTSGSHNQLYVYIYGALIVGTITTVTVGYLSLPVALGIVIALIIAAIKGSLVASFFMHLTTEKTIIHRILMLTGVFLLSMFLLIAGAFSNQIGHSTQVAGDAEHMEVVE